MQLTSPPALTTRRNKGIPFLVLLLSSSSLLSASGAEYDYGAHPRFVCTPIPADTDPSCFPPGVVPGAGGPAGPPAGGAAPGVTQAKANVLHLRESLVQQKETILDQRETIRELTAKLALCEGFGRGNGGYPTHHAPPMPRPALGGGGRRRGKAALDDRQGEMTPSAASSPEQMERMLQALKERLDTLQTRNTSTTYSTSLKDLLQRKISALEQQMQQPTAALSSGDPRGNNDSNLDDGDHDDDGGDYDNEADGRPRKKTQGLEGFQIGFPMRTNYMYGRVKRTLLHEIFALTLCLWMKGGARPGLGTPLSYSVPGQANELVLIEWGNNPMELLVNDRAVTLPLSLSDGKWHHVCVTWSTRDGLWEAYQDGVKRGSGENLSPWHPIKAGGVFILGQEQDTLGGRFDATQAFVGEMSELQMWSHVLSAPDIYSLASCASHMTGDIIAWAESALELHGGISKYPFDPCH